MANEHGLFWNSQNGDRVYDANDFSEWLKKFYTTGVFNGDLEVTAAGGMTVSVSSGYVNIEGKVKFFSTPTTLTLATASGTYGRIDTVVAECNYTDREIKLKVVTGTYSISPTATAPVRTAAAYQLVLAQIDVAAGATEITQKNITDKRMDSNVCGLVTGTVSQIDFSTVKAQFDSWFDDVKGTLDTDVAGNLKNQIDAANEKIETNASAISDNQTAITALNNSLATKTGSLIANAVSPLNNYDWVSVKQTGNVVNVQFLLQNNGNVFGTNQFNSCTVTGVDLPSGFIIGNAYSSRDRWTCEHSCYAVIKNDGRIYIRVLTANEFWVFVSFTYIV